MYFPHSFKSWRENIVKDILSLKKKCYLTTLTYKAYILKIQNPKIKGKEKRKGVRKGRGKGGKERRKEGGRLKGRRVGESKSFFVFEY